MSAYAGAFHSDIFHLQGFHYTEKEREKESACEIFRCFWTVFRFQCEESCSACCSSGKQSLLRPHRLLFHLSVLFTMPPAYCTSSLTVSQSNSFKCAQSKDNKYVVCPKVCRHLGHRKLTGSLSLLCCRNGLYFTLEIGRAHV